MVNRALDPNDFIPLVISGTSKRISSIVFY